MEKAIGYIRSARKEGEGTSEALRRQEQLIREYCASVGFELVHLIEDSGASGAAALPDRPGGAELLRRLEQGELRRVIVAGVDRLTRAMHLFCEQIQDWSRRGIELHVVHEDGDVSVVLSTSGALVCEIAALFKKEYEERAAARGEPIPA